jgi:glycerophosphodiester phosphodiesterase
MAVLARNLIKVESFYKTRHAIIGRRVDVLHDHYGITGSTALDHANGLELEDLTAAFFELRDALEQLQWYEFVNFNKIVGRLCKFGGQVAWPPGTNNLRIPNTHLAIQTKCLKDLGYVTERLAKLRSKRLEARRDPAKTSLLQQKYYDELLSSLPSVSASSAIDRDDAPKLHQILEQSRKDKEPDKCNQERLLFAFLHFSTLNGSKRWVEMLLSRVESLREFGDHLHWLVIKIGRWKKLQDRQIKVRNTDEPIVLSLAVTEAIDQLVHVIYRLGFMLRAVLHRKDSFGQLPLHHAVQYGLFKICQEIPRYMKGYKLTRPSVTTSPALLPDSEELTALNIAVLTGDAAITELLMDHYDSIDAETSTTISHVGLLPGGLLITALKLGSFAIIQLLRQSIIDVNYKGYNDETALYLAVRSGRPDYVILLLEVSNKNDKMNLDASEVVYGWTPLIFACVNGDLPIMELLLRAGANPRVQDIFGWTAKDHAAFRGNLPITKMLMALDTGSVEESSRINGLHQMEQRIRKASLFFDHPSYFDQDSPPGYSQIYVSWPIGYLQTGYCSKPESIRISRYL